MSTASARTARGGVRGRTALDHLLAAFPALVLVLGILVFYGVEAWLRKTPWVFTDELEWSQISRSIASTGHAARRGQVVGFKSVYAFLIAPFWWLHSTAAAYSAIKYANVVFMTLAAVPTFLLARMLVSRRSAVAVAVLSITVPAMAYVTTLVPEVIAYPYSALCSWLIVRAFASKRRRDLLLAAVVAVGGLAVRSPELAMVLASFALAAVGLWVASPRGRALRAGWTKGDALGAALLLLGGMFLVNRVVLQHVMQWQVTTQYYKGRMFDLGLRAALSFVVGMGILPVVGGFASLRLRERRDDPAYRAFVAYASSAILCFGLYTAVKAAYLSTVFSTLWEERNLIYLSPLMLIGTALVFESKKVDWRVVGAASAFVLFVVCFKQFQLGYPYFEAPGFGIATEANRAWHWNVYDLRIAGAVTLGVSLLILASRRRRAVAVVTAALVLGWTLTGEIAATAGINEFSNEIRAHLPTPLNWVDVASGGQAVTYLGQEIKDPNGVWETEFWNRSLKHVDTLDAPLGPGPSDRPTVSDPTGTLSGLGDNVPYVLADGGVSLQATIVARQGAMRLYQKPAAHPWRLLDALQQVYSDGWCPEWCSYTYFKPGLRGKLLVTLSRTAVYGSTALPGQVKITVGTVRINTAQQTPVLKYVFRREHAVIHNGAEETISIPVARTPVRVELRIHPTMPPSSSDPRSLGAVVAFKFVPGPKR